MSDFVVIADSGCDLDEAYQKEYDIRMVYGHMVFPDKHECLVPLSWDTVSREDFYKDLKKRPDEYATSPANVAEFAEVMEQYAKENKKMLVMTISSTMSGVFNFATKAAEAVKMKYPETQIVCLDSMRFGPGFGLMVIKACELRDSGMSLKDAAAYLEQNKNRYHQSGWLDDLSFVAKKGRITHAQSFFGTLVGIKPLGEFDQNGMTTVLGKVKGAKKAYEVMLNYIAETIENPEEQTIFIAQTDRYAQAEQYKAMIEERFHPKKVLIKDVYPYCGINVGPGLMAAYYTGKPISDGLVKEREFFEKAVE